MAIEDALGTIEAKINELGKLLAPLTGFAGFLYGVDAKYRTYHTGTSYPFNTFGIEDMIAQIAGKDVVLAIDPKFSGAANKTFNIGAIFNNGTFGAVAVWGLHEIMPNKYTKLLKNVAFPPLLGYGVGRIFDDPSPGGSNPGPNLGNAQVSSAISQSTPRWLPAGAGHWTQ